MDVPVQSNQHTAVAWHLWGIF